MTYNPNIDSGFCEVKSWVQIPSAVFIAIDQSNEHDDAQYPQRTARNYAQMVYNVNPSTISLSGASISINSVGLDDSGTVKLSGDQLKVYDQQAIDKLYDLETAINNISVSVTQSNYSKIVKTNGNYMYVMDASIGSGLSGDAIWRVQRVYDDGNTVVVDWADGNDNFDNIAANYLSLTYGF